ncbi:hypothetical protein N2152v2_003479 [Parachlorella kessleri]
MTPAAKQAWRPITGVRSGQRVRPRFTVTAGAAEKLRGGLTVLPPQPSSMFGKSLQQPHDGPSHTARDVAVGVSPNEKVPLVRDAFKEESRKEMRSVFDFNRWAVHRSSSRYLRHMLGIFNSRLIKGLAAPLVYVVGLATAVAAYETARSTGVLPPSFPDVEIKSKELFGLTSFALALLLAYRTNASYERWDGARKMWGLVLNRSRDITRQGLAWIPEDKPELRAMLCRWVPAFSKSLMCHLRPGEDIRKELEGILLPHEIEGVVKSTHRPNYVLQVLAQIIRSSEIPVVPTLRMEDNLTNFEDCLGGCERILRTPIPLYYTRHTSRFMMIWLTLLPFALWPACEWATVPLSGIIAFLLLGVEEIGVAIEEPFTILALEAISGTALTNVRELEAMHGTNALTGDNDGAAIPVSAPDMIALAVLAKQKEQLELAAQLDAAVARK